MVLNSSGPAKPTAPSSSIPSSRMGKPPGGRRFRSRGTIAGFGSSAAAPEPNGADTATNATTDSAAAQNAERSVPQHAPDASTPPAKPCHTAWLALLSTQNAIRMGAKTQLGLCPPGRSRRSLQQALRHRRGSRRTRQPSMRFDSEMTAYFGIDKMLGADALMNEEDYLSTTNTFDVESDEEASSGDEDELFNIEEIIMPDTATSLDDETKYATLREPLFNPVGAESPNQKITSPSSTTPGKLPFNRRKLRYFDSITASDSARARAYLREEARKCKQRDGIMLARHLRRMQRRERRRLQLERGEIPDFDNSDDENENPQETALLKSGVAQFKEPMTASMAAALVLESLSLNPKESIEGMAKCYDGIVAAGVALLDSQIVASPDDDKPRRAVIMAALEPLLITSLEQPSGEVVLQLAKLRRMCGTPRYQRRFVQRVAPCLVRPPHAAMWCLQHQNDMEPILAAVEMIFDSAFEIFKKGWYQRGQALLADSVRKETLNTAAEQLKNMSSVPEDGPSLALNSTGHGMRRPVMMKGGTPIHDGSGRKEGSAPLAEWEVIAVDRQIRTSISNILSNDWSRVAIVSRDVENALKNRRPGANVAAPTLTRSRSGGEASPRSITSSPVSPTRMAAPSGNPPLSPPSPKALRTVEPPATENLESVFGPSFASQPRSAISGTPEGESLSVPPSPVATPVSPPMPQRKGLDEGDSSSLHKGQLTPSFAAPSANMVSPLQTESDSNTSTDKARTPPRSPSSHSKEETVQSQTSLKGVPQAASPVRGTQPPDENRETTQNASSSPSHPSFASLERVERAPLSPSGSVSSDAAPFRPASSSGASVSSSTTGASSQPAHYRMLTSTAAERKRTVAACRALRAQISRFEEAFMQLHGRAPKGAAERAPLATTYAQYREWKRAIRADAACRIQALFRGARARWTLLRSNNPRIARVIMTRAGRASFATTTPLTVESKTEDAVIKQLSIPREIDAKEGGRGPRLISNARTNVPAQPTFDDASFDTLRASNSSAPLAPQWSTPGRRTSGGTASTPPPYASPQGSPSPTGAVSGYHHLSLQELQARKKELKQQLKQYDMNFARQHGRMPVKSEKEPIRHLYENYNALKSQISMLEQEGQHLPPPVAQAQRPSPRSRSPPLGMVAGPDGSDDSPPSLAVVRQRRRPSRPSPPLAESAQASTPAGAPSQDLAALKAEKQQLHQMLRSYEKDFFREHKRQVSSFADIKPVASQYRRYKEIKKAIATLQQRERERQQNERER